MPEDSPALPDLPPLALPGLPDLPALPALDGPLQRRLPPGGARREWQRARVVEVREEAARARTFRLALPVWHAHVPGQHYVVRLTAPDGYRAERSYSVASAPEDVGHVELSVERLEDGEVSTFLHDAVRPGDELEVRGPFGGWFVWRGDVPVLLVGGGSGVVPLLSMLRHHTALRERGGAVPPLHLVVSARSPEELFSAPELLDDDRVTAVFTRAAPPGWARAPGRLRAEDLAGLVAPGVTAYVCGSTGFARTAEELLLAAGLPPGDLRVERFGPS